jgi:hypothetical protein
MVSDAPGGDSEERAPGAETPVDQNGEAEKPGAKRASSASEARWIASHVNLDLLPSAYAVLHHRFDIGSKINMPPIGVPASRYSVYPDIEFAPTPRTVLALGAATADRLHAGGSPVYYTVGIQHQFLAETHRLPAVAVGGYGLVGPHDHHGGAAYVVASRQLTSHGDHRGAFVHAGVLVQTFSGEGSGTDAQPFLGADYVWNRRMRFSGEYRPKMSWEASDPYTLRGVFMVTRQFGFSAGYRQNGYRAEPFIGIEID